MSDENPQKKAVILLSGGLDSSTVLAIAKDMGFSLYAMSFNYKQRNSFEIENAKQIAEHFSVESHKIIDINLRDFGGSSLTSELEVEKNRSLEIIGKEIPSTYVPVRNTLFLSYALAWAEVLEAQNIFIGVNALDHSGYPDCRPEFVEAFERLANLATKMSTQDKKKIEINTPLLNLSKSEIIKLGIKLNVPYQLTMSCYDPLPDKTSCGECDSCILRQKAFLEIGNKDPISYSQSL